MKVNEIYRSIQGESSYSGLPCVFVRLTYCHLRCSYCDTAYAFYEGNNLSVMEVFEEVLKHGTPLVEITGGEPLLQAEVYPLMDRLIDSRHTVLLETGGSLDVGEVNPQVIKIMDLKCPSSGECHRNLYSNIEKLQPHDCIRRRGSRRGAHTIAESTGSTCSNDGLAALLGFIEFAFRRRLAPIVAVGDPVKRD